MNEYVNSVRQTINDAEKAVKECIKALLVPFGDIGLDLNYHTSDCYSVVSEYSPNEFHIVEWVRVTNDGRLEMLLENDSEWKPLYHVDWGFLLDEVESAIECETKN